MPGTVDLLRDFHHHSQIRAYCAQASDDTHPPNEMDLVQLANRQWLWDDHCEHKTRITTENREKKKEEKKKKKKTIENKK